MIKKYNLDGKVVKSEPNDELSVKSNINIIGLKLKTVCSFHNKWRAYGGDYIFTSLRTLVTLKYYDVI